MTAEQLRAARAMLRWDQRQIAAKADVSRETIKRLEKMDGPLLDARGATLAAIQDAFERAGVAFTDDNGVSLKTKPANGR
jgi:transcriptional regulator with XRE-family HTH domain